jgi:hypothetical protein
MRIVIYFLAVALLFSQYAVASEEDLLMPTSFKVGFGDGTSIELVLEGMEYKKVIVGAYGKKYELGNEDLKRLSGLGFTPDYVTRGAFYNHEGVSPYVESSPDEVIYFRFSQTLTPVGEGPRTAKLEVYRSGKLRLIREGIDSPL